MLITANKISPTQQLKDQWCDPDLSPVENLRSVVANLREQYTLSRTGASSAKTLSEFLDQKQGGDHLFATTAALLARQLGLQSRLVTGFYVRPDSYDFSAGHSVIEKRDFHVWAEVKLEDGRWFEIEPTPSYQHPYFGRSLWLRFTDALKVSAPFLAWGCLVVGLLFFTRLYWVNWILHALWATSGWRNDRGRLKLAMQVIECRARLVGYPRSQGDSQRIWLEKLACIRPSLREATESFVKAADAVFFSERGVAPPAHATNLVKLLTLKTFSDITKDPST